MADNAPKSSILSLVTQHFMGAIGGIVVLAGIIPFVTAHTVKVWVKAHSYAVFIALIIVLAAGFILIDILQNRKRQEPTEHDRKAVEDVLGELAPTSFTIRWLRHSFVSKSIPIKYLDELDRVSDRMHLNIIGFDNPKIDRPYGSLRSRIDDFVAAVNFNMFSNGNYTAMEPSDDWSHEQWLDASKQIGAARSSLVEEYAKFVRLCHKHQLYST